MFFMSLRRNEVVFFSEKEIESFFRWNVEFFERIEVV